MSCALHPRPERPAGCTCAAEETPEQGRAIRIARMRRLADLGMRLAEKVVEEVETAAVAPDAEDPTLRFTRVARVVHQITALEARLANPLAPHGAGAVAPSARPEPPSPYDLPSEDDLTVEIFDIVHALIAKDQTPRAADDATADIYAEMEDRFDGHDLIHRPLGEIAAEVARAFVLRPDWAAWTGEPWVADAIARWDALMEEDAEASAQSP